MSDKKPHIHCIYASTSGNTEYAVETASGIWQQQGAQVELHKAQKTPIDVVTKNQRFLFATSTWDHGTLNPYFNALYAELQTADLSGKTACFIGLGDRRYEHYYFCTGMKLLQEVWQKNGGTTVGTQLTIGREPYEEAITNIIIEWATVVAKELL